MSALLPIEIAIDELKEIARGPREQFTRIARRIAELRFQSSDAGVNAMALAMVAKSFALQMHQALPENEIEMRGIARALSVCLQNQLNAADVERRPRRYYAGT